MSRTGPATRSFNAPATRSATVTTSASTCTNTAIPIVRSVALSPAILSQAPSSHCRQHHDVTASQVDATAFRTGWFVRTRLYGLLEAGQIEREHLEAALTWRRWVEFTSTVKVQSWDIRVDQPVASGRSDGGMGRRIDAAARLRAAVEALGALRIAILEACVVYDRSWAELGRRLRASDKTAKDRTAEAVLALTAWLAGDPVPPMPEIRFRNQPGSW